jgi:tetratricopeptide (TPR) repeat protein
MLEKMTAAGSADSFAWYALALEYKKEERVEDALRTFEALRARDPNYLPMYLMAGQMLLDTGRAGDARGWLEQGIELAQRKGDQKALGELEGALAGA